MNLSNDIAPVDARTFSQRVLHWFDQHGRKQLPWQENPTPYRVWVSEIMLQQTQVTTVARYYPRFMAAFPDICALADAELDAVLRLWAGLGYYARARHLHRAAQCVRDDYHGEMPRDHATLQTLPGIGRSTAGAILALSHGQRWPILDANVKRVLTRFAAMDGFPGQSAVQKALWELADHYTPAERVADYTQAMMDVGALICVPRRPQCACCPLATACVAHAQGCETDYPTPKPRQTIPVRTTRMLLIRSHAGEILIMHRPPTGIWGGLWSLPECPMDADVATWCLEHWGLTVAVETPWHTVRHVFTHFRLDITPVPVTVLVRNDTVVREGERFAWCAPHCADQYAMPPPVVRLLSLASFAQ